MLPTVSRVTEHSCKFPHCYFQTHTYVRTYLCVSFQFPFYTRTELTFELAMQTTPSRESQPVAKEIDGKSEWDHVRILLVVQIYTVLCRLCSSIYSVHIRIPDNLWPSMINSLTLSLCVCVCMCVCMWVCMCVCIICVCFTHVSVAVLISLSTYVHAYHVLMHAHVLNMHTSI